MCDEYNHAYEKDGQIPVLPPLFTADSHQLTY